MSQQAELSTAIDSIVPGTCNVRIIVDNVASVCVKVNGYDAKGVPYFRHSEFSQCTASPMVIERTRAGLFTHLEKQHSAIAIDYSLSSVERTEPHIYERWILTGLGWKKMASPGNRDSER